MKLTILLLLVGVCIVTAKYLPDEWENSGQLLSRYKRSDSDESDGSSEDDNNSNNNNEDGDLQNRDVNDEQSKRIAKMEKMREKLLEKQEKERKKQEEIQRKLEEKIAKELEKEEEKRQKEKRKQEKRLEKERKKLEEEQKKIQEKIIENERKRQERIEKELEEIEKNTRKIQESSESYADNSLKELFKIQIYSKYGINESNTNLERKEALSRYLREELGLSPNSTESERRKAILDLVQNKLQNASETNALQNQLIEYVKFVGVQKIRQKIEKDIEKLQNKTETLNNVNLTWVPSAKQNIAEQVSFLETIKQLLPNVLPSWLGGSQPQVNASVSSNVDNKNLRNSTEISQDTSNATQESNGLDVTTDQAIDKLSSVSLSGSGVGSNSIAEVTSYPTNNDLSVISSSSVVTETSYTESGLAQDLSPSNVASSVNGESNGTSPTTTQNIANEVVSSTLNGSPNIVDQKAAGASSIDSNISTVNSIDITTENVQNPVSDISSSLNSADGVESSLLLPNPQSTKASVLPGNDQLVESQNSSQIGEVNTSLVQENNNNFAGNQTIDGPSNLNTVTIENVPVSVADTNTSLNSVGDANSSSVLSSPDLTIDTSTTLTIINDNSFASQNINSYPNTPSVSNSLPVDTAAESDLSVNSAVTTSPLPSSPIVTNVNSPLLPNNSNKPSQNVDSPNDVNNLETIPIATVNEYVPVVNADTTPSGNLTGDGNSLSILPNPDLTNEISSLLPINNNNNSVANLNSGDSTTEFVSNLILDSVLSVNSAISTTIFPSSNNTSSSDSQIMNETEISTNANNISLVAITENVPNLIVNIILSDNSTTDISSSGLVSGNNTELPSNVTESPKNVSIVEVTAENVTNPIESIDSINLANSDNLSSSSPIPALNENPLNVGFEVNAESNNLLNQIVSGALNVSSESDSNKTNSGSNDLQSILSQPPSTEGVVDGTNETTSPNESAVNIGGIINIDQQVTVNEVTSLSTEPSVIAETTILEASTSETILQNTEAILINTVPQEPGAVVIDVVNQ